MTRIYKSDSTATWHECEACLVTLYCLIGEVLEDLLKRRLRDTVLLDAKLLLGRFELAKEPSNGLVLLGDT